MRILILSDRIPPDNKGGAERAAWNLALGLKNAGHDVHVVAATEKPAFEEEREGIPTYHIHAHYPERFRSFLSLYNPQTAGPLKKLYRRIQPDVINAHNIHSDLTYHALTLAHAQGIAAVFSSHDVMPFAYTKLRHFIDPSRCGVSKPEDYRLPRGFNLRQARFRYNPLRNWRIRQVLTHHTQRRVTPSNALKQAHEANGLPHFDVVPYGFDADNFTASPQKIEELRGRLDLHGRKVILFAGRLTGAKGTQETLQMMRQLVASVPEALLLVLTARPIDEQVNQPQFKHLNGTHVRSGGWLTGEELVAAYHVADVVIAPSIILDTFPVVNLEAMAAGKPAVSTCYGGSPEAVVDGETGYIINPFDTDQFTDRIQRLFTDDELHSRMGKAGYERIKTVFPIQRQVNEMLEIYEIAVKSIKKS